MLQMLLIPLCLNIAIVTDAICGVVKLYISKQLYATLMLHVVE